MLAVYIVLPHFQGENMGKVLGKQLQPCWRDILEDSAQQK